MSRNEKWAIAVIVSWACAAAIGLGASSAYKTRIDLETRKECFASNERIAKTLEKSETRIGTEFNRCDWS